MNKLLLAPMLLVVFLSGCVGQPSSLYGTTTTTTSSTTSTAALSVSISSSSTLGSYLVDSRGFTLYHFTQDIVGTQSTQPISNCVGNCRGIWPVFYTTGLTVGTGLNSNDFTVFTRSDGASQIAYKGMPLYYYSGDSNPGDTNGQGIQNIWFVVNPSTSSTTTSSTSTTSTTSAYNPYRPY